MPAGLGSWGRFLTSGVFNTAVTYLLYLALLPRLHYRLSFTIAYASGIALAYVLNRFLVFRKPGGKAGPLLVTLIYLGQYVVNLGIVSVAVRWFHVPPALAPLCAIVMTVPLTYVLNRRVFGGAQDRPEGLHWSGWMRPWLRPIALTVLVGLPMLSLALNAIAWLRFGFDLPFFDDWRAYDSGDVDSLESTYLFQSLNDTLTPIGLALDALVQRVLDGNSILYQLLSMLLVLGALLVLQWKLLRIALGDPLRTAICFVFTLLMLQPGSYWGRENLAYQQALPLVFILAALWLSVARPWRDLWNLPAIFVLAVLSGFTYISGAFGAFAAGVGVVVMALLSRNHAGRVRTLLGGAALALGGALTSAVQLVMAVLPSKGGTHAEDKALALPHEADFWMFYLGKVARSLLLPADQPLVSLAIVALALVGFVAALLLTLRAAQRVERDPARFLAFSAVFAALGAMVVIYLALVAAGRANFRPDDVQSATDVFAFGFQRFHFFWATLAWPWLVAALLIASERRVPGATPASVRRVGAAALGAAVVAMVWLGALDHFQFQRRELANRHATVDCLMEELQRGKGIRCEEWRMQDLTNAYIYARRIGASFVRHFPIFPIELGTDTPAPLFRLSRDAGRVHATLAQRDESSALRGGKDARIDIDAGGVDDMANCAMLDVRGRIKAGKPDILTIYFKPPGQRDYLLRTSSAHRFGLEGQATTFTARLDSASGFERVLRIDPTVVGQPFEIGELEVRCRIKRPTTAGGSFFSLARTREPGTLTRLTAIGDGPGRYRAGDLPTIEFHTGQRHNMASCRVLQVEPNFRVEKNDSVQVFFKPRGVAGFSEENSATKPVEPSPEPLRIPLVIRSDTGFDDRLRLDPVKQAQSLQFIDVTVRCLERILRPRPAN